MRPNKSLVLILGFALIMAACGGGGATTTTAAGETTTTTAATGETTTTTAATGGELEGVELKLWGGSSSEAETAALTALLDAFNAETGANAVFEAQADLTTACNTALAGGKPPGVFDVDSNKLPDLAAAGARAPVPIDVIARSGSRDTRRCPRSPGG